MRIGRFYPAKARIGNTVVGDGFSSTEVSFQRLSFHAIGYGDKVRIVDLIKRKIHTGDDFEINQRTNLHLSAAAEWHCSGRTARSPSNHRVGFLAKEFRMAEVQQVEEALERVGGQFDGNAIALKSPIRAVTTPRHGSDYRALSCFLLPRIRTICSIQLCAIEPDELERQPTVYCFDYNGERECANQHLFCSPAKGIWNG